MQADQLLKKLLLYFVLWLPFYSVSSQSQINMLRYNDDFSDLKNDTLNTGFERLKYIQLRKQSYISFGADLREQFQYFDNLNFGDVSPDTKKSSVGQLWHRLMVNSNIEIGKQYRIFLQLNSTFRFFNPNPLTPEIDENRLSLHQAFIDYKFYKHWVIRVGRQEVIYGNSRLISIREGPNTRLTFDGAVVGYATKNFRMDVFGVSPVISKPYEFDDKAFQESLIGLYATAGIINHTLFADVYFMNYRSDIRSYNFMAGKENRQISGFRLFSKNPAFNYEIETTYQIGNFNELSIRAYSISGNVRLLLYKPRNAVVGISGNYISGDKDRTDKILNTYNFLFSKPQFGLAAPIGSSNIENVNPYISIAITKKLQLVSSVYFMQRQSNQDGTYSPGAAQVRPAPRVLFVSGSRSIGIQYALESSYVLTQNLTLFLDAAYFRTGMYVRETGAGRDITYLALKGSLKI